MVIQNVGGAAGSVDLILHGYAVGAGVGELKRAGTNIVFLINGIDPFVIFGADIDSFPKDTEETLLYIGGDHGMRGNIRKTDIFIADGKQTAFGDRHVCCG